MRPSIRLLAGFQWFGLLAGAAVWTAQHVVGYGIGQAQCVAGGMHWGIGNDVWQLTLLSCAGLVVVLAEVAAVVVYLATRGADYGSGPPGSGRFGGRTPYGRLNFFAMGAMLANALFLAIMLLDGLAASFDVLCRQS
ncbi:MAG TPA: hypothetical protein VFJ77_09440 [Gaiellaceae bacterium]|nr:hypothetical protein [Gaiellaceae bacterium]